MSLNPLKNINTPPTDSYFRYHYFCDYLELLAIYNEVVSISDIHDTFLDNNEIDQNADEQQAIVNDDWESMFNIWFSLIEVRANKFKGFYPFIIEKKVIKFKKKLTLKNKAYIFLLFNSVKSYIKNENTLTTDFEYFSFLAFKHYLPNKADVHQFGKSKKSNSKYKGSIVEKIKSLAKDLGCNTAYEPHYFSNKSTGDGGLDIIAWISFDKDIKKFTQLYLGQCATGRNWTEKQSDTLKFNNYISFSGSITHTLFLPYDGRNHDDSFNEEASILKNTIVFDRLRMLSLISNFSFLKKLESFNVIDNVLKSEGDIV